ncbi:MAG TPA: efflux RND transporter permease subunit, partial [Patescibacteria group bacterium]|nr:efflux RND transporter permease subunit [Patescibacteria group bacterium]
MLPAQGILKQDLFPEQDQDYFAVNIEEPIGTPLEKTSETASRVEKLFLGDKRIRSFQVNIGSRFNTYISNSSGGEHVANIIVNLREDREKESFEIAEEYRSQIKELDIFPAEAQVVQLTAGPPSGSAITVNITGPSLTKLDELSEDIKTELDNIPGSANVQVSREESHAQFAIDINRAKAQVYGVNTQQVAGVLRNAISGSEATVIRGGGDDTDVTVKYDLNGERDDRISPDTISSLTIATPKGDIPLSNFTSLSLESKRAFIDHEEGERIAKVTGESTNNVSPITVTGSLKERIDKMDVPADYEISFGGEEQDINQSFNDMIKALLLGIFIIAMIMVLQFKSFRQPLFILASIPLSVIGIFPGLVLTGQALTFPGVIGIVALAGIVVNNAILLIDAINQRRLQGVDKKEAVIQAGQVRFQPIILTAATTIGGMIPLAFSNPT